MKRPMRTAVQKTADAIARERSHTDIEPLESRIVLSGGIGTGMHEKAAAFRDAAGNLVTVRLTEGAGGTKNASFNITLDGGVSNYSDIDTILLNGTDQLSTLSITVAGAGGQVEVNDIAVAVGVTKLGAISTSGALLQELDLSGVTLGTLAVSKGLASETFLGLVNVGSVNRITVAGADSTVTGPILATGAIGTITGLHLDILGTVQAASIGSINVPTIDGDIITTSPSSPLGLQVHNLNGSIEVAGDVNMMLTGPFSGSVDAGGNINGLGGAGTIFIFGGNTASAGTLHSSGGNIAGVTVTGTGGFGGAIIADAGNIGAINANNLSGATIDAVAGSVASITASSATALAAIANTIVHAGTTIGKVTASDAAPFSTAISGSTFRADGGFTDGITGTARTFGSAGIINSTFSTAGNVIGDIIANAAASQAALSGDMFSAGGSLAYAIQAGGNVTGSTFLAGYDIGPGGVLNGTGDSPTPTDGVFIGPITIAGQMTSDSFASGVTITGTGVGTSTDVYNNTGGTIMSLSVSGAANNDIFEAGSLFTGGTLILSKAFSSNTLHAYSGDIGDIQLVGSVYGADAFANNTIIADAGNIGNILIANTATTGGSAIANLTVTASVGTVGDIVGITDGTGDGIGGASVSAGMHTLSVVGIASALTGGSGLESITLDAGNIGAPLSNAGSAFISAHSLVAPTAGVVGISNGTGCGISNITLTGTVIGDIFGVDTNSAGGHGIFGIQVSSGEVGDIVGISHGSGAEGIAAGYSVVTQSNLSNVINAGYNIGSIVGISTSITGGSGIDTVNATAGIYYVGTEIGSPAASFITTYSSVTPTAGIIGISSGSGHGITNVTLNTQSNIGNIFGLASGSAGGDGIFGLNITTTGAVGDIVGITHGAGSEGIAYGYSPKTQSNLSTTISAGFGTGTIAGISTASNGSAGIDSMSVNDNAGSIGTPSISAAASAFITANSSLTNLMPGIIGNSAGGAGITGSTFYTGGGIGAISGVTASLSSDGIVNSKFGGHGGGIGNITAVTATGTAATGLGISDSIFTTFPLIAGITVTGNVAGSSFLAGVDENSTFSLATALYGGGYIGNVSVTGTFTNSNLIAAVNPGTDLTFGTDASGADTNAMPSGTIGTVKLMTASTFSGLVSGFSESGQTSAIEAHTIGAVTAGSGNSLVTVPTSSGGSLINWYGDGAALTAVRTI